MAIYRLENARLSISVDSMGAELRSLRKLSDDVECGSQILEGNITDPFSLCGKPE